MGSTRVDGSEKKRSRNEAIRELNALGLSIGELVRLEIRDVFLELGELQLRFGAKSERVLLPDALAKVLERWLTVRGRRPGALFSSLKEGGSALTYGGMALTIARMQETGTSQLRIERRESAKERLEIRNRAIVCLYEAGLKTIDLARLKVEDLRSDGIVLTGGLHYKLPGDVLAQLKEWCEQRHRKQGPVFVSAIRREGPITPAAVSWILRVSRANGGDGRHRAAARRRKSCGAGAVPNTKQVASARSPSSGVANRLVHPLILLWEALPAELRRRVPESDEERELVCRIVEEAVSNGALLSEALRLSGLALNRNDS